MSTYNVNSLLVIHLTATSGTIKIPNEIPLQKIVLKQYGVHFSNSGNHPGLILFDIQPFTSATINSNQPISGAVPLICNIQGKDTVQQADLEIDLDRSVTREFNYRLLEPDGTFVSDFQSCSLVFNYNNGVLF